MFPHHRQVEKRIWPADLAMKQIKRLDAKAGRSSNRVVLGLTESMKAAYEEDDKMIRRREEAAAKAEEERIAAEAFAKAEEDEKSRRERLSCTCMSVCVCIDDEPWISEEDEEDYEAMEEIGSDYSYFHVSCTCMSVCVCIEAEYDYAEPVDEAEDMDEILAEPVDVEPVDTNFDLMSWIDLD